MSDPAARSPGCVLLILDESAAMLDPFTIPPEPPVPGTRWPSRLETVATAVNALLKRLGNGGADFDVALLGYRSNGREADIGVRWQGPLAGRKFVSTRELSASHLRVERRERTDFRTGARETVDFPVWYGPAPAGKSLPAGAFQAGLSLLDEWRKTSAGSEPAQPLVIHIFGGLPADGGLFPLARQLVTRTGFAKPPLLLQMHLSGARSETGVLREPTVPATQYPASPQSVPAGYLWELYPSCSPLTAAMRATLREGQVPVTERSVGLVANARPLDLIQLLKLVDVHTSGWPARSSATQPLTSAPADPTPSTIAAEASALPSAVQTVDETVVEQSPVEAPATEQPVGVSASDEASPARLAVEPASSAATSRLLLILLLDRSTGTPTGGEVACVRLQERMNEMLGRVAKLKSGRIDVAAISYGGGEEGAVALDPSLGTVEVVDAAAVVEDLRLESVALRIEQTEELVDDGAGGLVPWPKKTLVFFEQAPAAAANPRPAFEAALRLAQDWSTRHTGGASGTLTDGSALLVHFTRGEQSPDEIAETANLPRGDVLLQHVIVTESPQASVSYPSDDSLLDSASLKAWFQTTSVLPIAAELAAAGRAGVTAESRGFVVNARFDVVKELLTRLLEGSKS